MGQLDLREGDEIVVLRRRRDQIQLEGGETETRVSDTEVSAVRCPQDEVLIGGDIEPEYVTETTQRVVIWMDHGELDIIRKRLPTNEGWREPRVEAKFTTAGGSAGLHCKIFQRDRESNDKRYLRIRLELKK